MIVSNANKKKEEYGMKQKREIISRICYLTLVVLANIRLSLCANPSVETLNKSSDKTVWVTVLVHGIIMISPSLVVENLAPIISDKAKRTRYGKTVKVARKNPVLFENQAMQEEGLHAIDLSRHERGYGAGALANALEVVYDDIENCPHERKYYTFGWQGLLSHKTRVTAGKHLFDQLNAEIHRLKSEGYLPRIRLIGYSHGGNVCLNVGREAQLCHPDWYVEELILVATPIQNESDYLVQEKFFKKCYSIYSESDHVQSLDFFSFNRFFSRKRFKNHKKLELPDNLTQIRIKVRKHLKDSQIINPPIQHFVSKNRRAISPGHVEFWFFGWTPKYYRKSFPFNPIPMVTFIPYVIGQINCTQSKTCPCKPVVVTIAPAYEQMNIKNSAIPSDCAVDFIPMDEINQLKELILSYKPNNYPKKYDKAKRRIFKKARRAHQEERFDFICQTKGRCCEVNPK